MIYIQSREEMTEARETVRELTAKPYMIHEYR